MSEKSRSLYELFNVAQIVDSGELGLASIRRAPGEKSIVPARNTLSNPVQEMEAFINSLQILKDIMDDLTVREFRSLAWTHVKEAPVHFQCSERDLVDFYEGQFAKPLGQMNWSESWFVVSDLQDEAKQFLKILKGSERKAESRFSRYMSGQSVFKNDL